MSRDKETLLQWIERDRRELIDLASALIRARSPNPPGDTRAAAAVIRAALKAENLPCETLASKPDRPNVVSSFTGGRPGRNLVLNGHMDVLPVVEGEAWKHDPWSGAVSDGRIWGRGATNMKCGLAIAVFVFVYLRRLRRELNGSLTFSAVSDEVVLGDHGTRYLMERAPQVLGDACLIAEPSGLSTIRFGEKGPMRLRFHVHARGGHGAFTHLGEGAVRAAARLIADLDGLEELDVETPDGIGSMLDDAAELIDECQGAGASRIVRKPTVTIASIRGGIAKNMIPAKCELIADVRLPVGMDGKRVTTEIDRILKRHPGARVEEMDVNPPAWCDPHGEIVRLIRANVKRLKGFEPSPVVSLGCTDARLWRYRGIPAYNYGPPPKGMGGVDEHVDVEDFLHVMRTHALTAYDYLARN